MAASRFAWTRWSRTFRSTKSCLWRRPVNRRQSEPARLLAELEWSKLNDNSADETSTVDIVVQRRGIAPKERITVNARGRTAVRRKVAKVSPEAEMPPNEVFHASTDAPGEFRPVGVPLLLESWVNPTLTAA